MTATSPAYAYDVAKAKALLAEAGLADGFETELYVDQHRSAAAHRPGDPAGPGGDRHQGRDPRAGAGQRHRRRRHRRRGADDLVGRHGLDRRLPDPSNFYGPILGCGGAVQGGWNWSWYCNDDLDKRAAAADAMSDPAKAAERTSAWGEIFTDVMKDAPWVPVINERRVVAKSLRMGGADNIYIDPTRVINYDAIYVNQ